MEKWRRTVFFLFENSDTIPDHCGINKQLIPVGDLNRTSDQTIRWRWQEWHFVDLQAAEEWSSGARPSGKNLEQFAAAEMKGQSLDTGVLIRKNVLMSNGVVDLVYISTT